MCTFCDAERLQDAVNEEHAIKVGSRRLDILAGLSIVGALKGQVEDLIELCVPHRRCRAASATDLNQLICCSEAIAASRSSEISKQTSSRCASAGLCHSALLIAVTAHTSMYVLYIQWGGYYTCMYVCAEYGVLH